MLNFKNVTALVNRNYLTQKLTPKYLNLYKVIEWPSDIEFQDYSKLKEEERTKVLKSLNNIRFELNEC